VGENTQVRQLYRDALSGKLNRREVFQRGIALGLSANVIGMLALNAVKVPSAFAAEEGKPLADLYGACATQAAQSAAQESLDDLEGLGYKIVNSASWGAGTAIVNITFSPSSSDSSPYSFQMQQEGGKWKVCTFTKGHFVVDTE